MRHGAKRDTSIFATSTALAIGAGFLLSTPPAFAEPDQPPAQSVEPPLATKAIGGHVGIAVPFVTISKHTTTIGDQFTILDPIGIGFRLSEHVAVDFETVVGTPVHPTGKTSLVVDPGVIFPFGKLALGLRVAFQINADANFGLIPLVNYALVDLGHATWFVEAAFPTFYSDKEVALTALLHTGVGF
jgi:hypothetical protein